MVPETEGDVEDAVWVTMVVDGLVESVESAGGTRGRELVDEAVRWEDVDEVVRLPVEDEEVEVEGLTVRVVVGAVSEGCNLVVVGVGVPTLVLVVGEPGWKMLEKKDSIGFCAGVVVVVGRSWRFTRARSTGGMNMVVVGVVV